MEELRRRMARRRLGRRLARLVTPAEIKELVPFIDESILVGGFYTPERRRRRLPARRARSCARRREAMGAPARCSRTPRSRRWTSRTAGSGASHTEPRHDRGRVRRHRLRRLGPLLARDGRARTSRSRPVVHQMIDVGPVPRFETIVERRSSSRSSATWTCSCTSARTASASRSARTPTARSSTTRRRSRRSRRRRSRRPSSPSRRTTSTRRWRTRSS